MRSYKFRWYDKLDTIHHQHGIGVLAWVAIGVAPRVGRQFGRPGRILTNVLIVVADV